MGSVYVEERTADSYRVLLEGGEGEYVEKKSRFIATLRKCESEEEAARFVEEMKKKYWDARHNCHAFIIGDRGELTRCSDDGEPSGTAGRPMLEVLTGAELRNAAVVVTRYFGGVLLGTGGLVRAYTQAVKEGLKNCKAGRMCYGHLVRITTDYVWIGRILYLLGNLGLEPVSSDYGERIVLKLEVPAQKLERLRREAAESTNGQAEFVKEKDIYFIDKEEIGD
ncbi:MAG: YigZ family protein [Lachnospiraceae bacterium]|nr:YigZ family protein [Lachnospiraceae bacterium]